MQLHEYKEKCLTMQLKAKVFFDKMKQEIPNETKYDTIGAVSGCCTFVHLMCLHFNVIFDV